MVSEASGYFQFFNNAPVRIRNGSRVGIMIFNHNPSPFFYSGKSFFWVKKQKKQQADIEKYDYFSFHKNRSLLFLQYMIIIKTNEFMKQKEAEFIASIRKL